jgi:hypothetical protein
MRFPLGQHGKKLTCKIDTPQRKASIHCAPYVRFKLAEFAAEQCVFELRLKSAGTIEAKQLG